MFENTVIHVVTVYLATEALGFWLSARLSIVRLLTLISRDTVSLYLPGGFQ